MVIFWVLSWIVFHGLSHSSEFSHKDEHVLGEVLGDVGHGALANTILINFFAHGHDVEDRLLELAVGEVRHDLSSLSEEVEVLMDL